MSNTLEFRTACHMAEDHTAPEIVPVQSCACTACVTKRLTATAHLDDTDLVEFKGDPTEYSVRELRAAAEAQGTPAALESLGGYAPHIAAIRAAEATPESFEEKWKAQRRAEFASEPARLAAQRAANGMTEPRIATLSDAKQYPSPDPYADDLKKLRERDASALATKGKSYY